MQRSERGIVGRWSKSKHNRAFQRRLDVKSRPCGVRTPDTLIKRQAATVQQIQSSTNEHCATHLICSCCVG